MSGKIRNGAEQMTPTRGNVRMSVVLYPASFPSIFVLLCIILLAGCNRPSTKNKEQLSVDQREAALEKSLDRKFEDPAAHYELGQLYQSQGQWTKAEYHYDKALQFDPVYRPAHAAMVKLFIDSGDKVKAKNYADIYMNQVSGSPSQLLELALEFQKQQVDEYALACFHKGLELAPNSASIHKYLGLYYLSKNDKVKAEEHLVASFKSDGSQTDVARELGRLGVQVEIPQGTEKSTKKP
jgi:tetratricopeptide (TPR) repeat protein